MKIGVLYALLFVFSFVSGIGLVIAEVNSSMTVEIDLIGFNGSSSEEIGIEVPDYLDLGELTNNNLLSNEKGIQINNTGTVDIRVTPMLQDPDEEIFKWLFFRKQSSTATNNTDLITFKKIGDYYLDIKKPAPGKTYNHNHSYVQLNLTEFTGRINEDIYNYSTQILFIATAI